jgi:hypothetical protein
VRRFSSAGVLPTSAGAGTSTSTGTANGGSSSSSQRLEQQSSEKGAVAESSGRGIAFCLDPPMPGGGGCSPQGQRARDDMLRQQTAPPGARAARPPKMPAVPLPPPEQEVTSELDNPLQA